MGLFGRKTKEDLESELTSLKEQTKQNKKTIFQQESQIARNQARLEELRKALEPLDAAIREKRSLVEAGLRELAKVTKGLKDAAAMKQELEKAESTTRQLREREKELSKSITKKEARIIQAEKVIEMQEAMIERHKKYIKEIQASLKPLATAKEALDKEIARRNAMLDQLKKTAAKIEKKAAEIQKQKTALDTKERELALKEARLTQLESKLSISRKELEDIAARKQEALAIIAEKKRVIEESHAAVGHQTERLTEIHAREKELRELEKKAKEAQKKADESLKRVDAREREFAQREKAWIDHDKAVREAAEQLSRERARLEDLAKTSKAELALIRQEWENIFASLKKEKDDMANQKRDVRELVDKDVALLREKEEELAGLVQDLDKERERIERDGRAIAEKVREYTRARAALEKREKAFGTHEKKLADRERVLQKALKFIAGEKRRLEVEGLKVERARALKAALPKLESRFNELTRVIRKLEARAMERGIAKPAAEVLRARERELKERERGVELEVGKLLEREREVEGLEKRREEAFETYLREEVEREKKAKPLRTLLYPEISQMIEDARDRIVKGEIDEATRAVAELEVLVEKVKEPEERRLFEYNIRDLKTSIKLATL